MSIGKKIKDSFSDFWFNLELMFASKPKNEEVKPGESVKKIENKSGVLGVHHQASKPIDASQILDEQTRKRFEKEERLKNRKLPFTLRHLKFSIKARLSFYDELSTLVGSGVTLIDSLSLIQAQERNKVVKKMYAQMIHDINAGLSLAESMELFPHVFPKMQSALVEAAEASGNLKEVLLELVEEIESSQDFHRKVTGAMVYPIILLFLAITLVVGMMIFVIPKIATMYEQARVELPGLTQTVIDISDFVVEQWPILLSGSVVGLLLLYLLFSKSRIGRLLGENIVNLIPMAGRINKEKNIMMIASSMAMLMKSGVLITDAFKITRKTINNLHYQKALEDIRKGVVMGQEVSQMMGLEDIRSQKFKEHPLFPLQMAQLIHIGESTGNIGNMFEKIKKNYHKSIEYSLRNISTLIEPVMIFFVAALVGSILMAVMLPFFYIGSTVG